MLLASFSVEAQIVNIPDANFKAKLLEASPSNTIAQNSSNQNIKIDINDDGEIQESEALLVRKLDVSNALISSLEGINSFINIRELLVNDNSLTSLNLNGLTSINYLEIKNNQIVSQDDLLLNTNTEQSLRLYIGGNLLSSFNLNSFINNNVIFRLNLISLTNNPIVDLNVELENYTFPIAMVINNTLLDVIEAQINFPLSLYISNNSSLQTVNLNYQINQNFVGIYIEQNQILNSISIQSDNIGINGSGGGSVTIMNNNSLNSLNLSGLVTNLSLYISNCPLPLINIENSRFNNTVTIQNINAEQIDLSSVGFGQYFITENQMLRYLNLKNGSNYLSATNYLGYLPQLEYVCLDDIQVDWYQAIHATNYPNINYNSYCSFVPGGEFYTIQGNTKIDLENNVCDENDIDFPSMKFNITNGSISGTIISNTSGNYSIPVQAGTHTITPVFENPTYFNVSPPSVAVTFPAQTSPFAQNFCVTPNGVHQDVEVVIVPLDAARPGFDASYGLVYKNKGNTTVSGSISLTYMDNVMDFLEANPIQSSIEPNILTWNYTNLQPFETRYITVSFNLNSPQETPALNGGEILNFTAIIDPISGDEMVSDNTSTLNQEVVNSYDPNDKTCLEGSVISTELIGQYVHYVIRFENTGTFFAQNVVVKDEIDVSKFDLNSLIVLSASHQQWTRINGNKVEFIFENIQLPFPPSEERHGYIAFKIKLKNNLTVGDTFSNFASIYFDYNFPIITEPATTTIEALSNPDFEFSNFVKLYPNPASATIIIESQTINLKSVEIFNSFGQLIQAIPNDNNQLSIDVSNLSTGTYFVKVHSDKGVGVSKFVKQ